MSKIPPIHPSPPNENMCPTTDNSSSKRGIMPPSEELKEVVGLSYLGLRSILAFCELLA